MKKKLWTILPLVLIALIVISLRLNYKHNTTSCNGMNMEIWSHRGVHVELPENSRTSVDKAYKTGFTGVEVDVFYDEVYGLVVSHDHPYKLVDGEIVLLKDVIYGYDDDFRFWLDLKNLSGSNHKKVKRALNQLFNAESGLLQRTLIESGNGHALRKLNPDFNCIYWVQFKRDGIRGWLKRLSIKFLMSLTNFEGITTDHRYIDETFTQNFKGKCWYVFTVNTGSELEALRALPEVEVVLTDLSKNAVNDLHRPTDI